MRHIANKVSYSFHLNQAEITNLDSTQHKILFAGCKTKCAIRAALDSMAQLVVCHKFNTGSTELSYGALVIAVVDQLALVTDQAFRVAHLQSHMATMKAKAGAKQHKQHRLNGADRYSSSFHHDRAWIITNDRV